VENVDKDESGTNNVVKLPDIKSPKPRAAIVLDLANADDK